MRVLVVYSNNANRMAPFIKEQIQSLTDLGVEIETFGVVGKGVMGYMKNRKILLGQINKFQPDVIHAHYGLSGLLANLQRRVPVVTTYHGSDINHEKVFRISKWAIKLSKHNIFVSQKNINKAKVKKKFSLIPCGVDTTIFYPQDKKKCREQMNLAPDKRYVLFAGAFDNEVKNPQLAKDAVAELENVELIELKGYNREQVACLMNAVDACLMTSYSEGSPQFIKEAMACNCPIVSVDVGDVAEQLVGVERGEIVSRDTALIKAKLQNIVASSTRSNGFKKIEKRNIDLANIAQQLITVYKKTSSTYA